jgi:hypothetical protein
MLSVAGKMSKAETAEQLDGGPSPPLDEKGAGYAEKIEDPLATLPDPDAGLSEEERKAIVSLMAALCRFTIASC